MKKITFTVCLILMLQFGFSETMFLGAPYIGYLEDTRVFSEGSPESNDKELMEGIYFQAIDTEKYQWNAFLYMSKEINYVDFYGLNAIYDYYFGQNREQKNVIGLGINYSYMQDSEDYPGTTSWNFNNTIFIPYIRCGRYLKFSADPLQLSFLPWVGYQYEYVNGEFEMIIPGPPPIETDISETDHFAIAGLNFKITYMHFIELQVKYSGTFNADDYFSTWSGQADIFFTRNLGVSYRYKFSEETTGEYSYNIFGVVLVF